MFTSLRLSVLAAVISFGVSVSAGAATVKTGSIAEHQLRYIATHFPGRMAGSPAEMLIADYLQQRFSQMGYQSDSRRFNTRYRYLHADRQSNWRNVSATSVIAAREGEVPQQIIIVAHSDSWLPRTDAEVHDNLGGLTSQAADSNASGLGVMLELAERLRAEPLHYSLRFVALSGEEIGQLGSEDYIARMKPEEKKNTLLVINIDSLIVGSHLTFSSGSNTPPAVARQTRDRALTLARRAGVVASGYRDSTAERSRFDQAGFPLLTVSATDTPGKQPTAVIRQHFPIALRHQAQRDNLAYIDRWLPGRITARTHASVAVLLPLIRELANPKT